MSERPPCVSCERKYGHLAGCEVERLHRQLDAAIRANGPDAVRIVAEPAPAEETSQCSSLA